MKLAEEKHKEDISDREKVLLEYVRLNQKVIDFLYLHPELSGTWPFREGWTFQTEDRP